MSDRDSSPSVVALDVNETLTARAVLGQSSALEHDERMLYLTEPAGTLAAGSAPPLVSRFLSLGTQPEG